MIDSVIGRYKVQELLNEGGTAAIYAAKDEAGQTVALRILLPQHRFNWTQRRMFVRGRKLQSKFKSEHVVQHVGRGSHKFRPYAIMEFVPGRNLRFLMLKQRDHVFQMSYTLMLEMALAMQEVHDQGLAHLDLKPENFLVTPYWKVKVTDFDLALPCGDGVMAKRKILQGTPVYLAPEQLDQTEFDQRADIFSFGLIAYEILSGGKRPTDKMLSNAPNFDLDMPPLSECNPTVPRGIQNVIGKCLASTPSQRYPSASALVRALQKEFELLSPAAS